MAGRLLFLVGGTEDNILDLVAEEFVPAAGGRDSTIALLMMGGQGWESYLPRYVEPWEKRGASGHRVIVPGDGGVLDLDDALIRLREATGIFIAGGHTPTYHRLYATEPIRSIIRQRYREGVPVAGLSAGALLAPDICVLHPSRTAADKPLTVVQGLGLVSDLVVAVHFTERNTLPILLEAMSRTRTLHGLGIAASACAVLENERLKHVLGGCVYQITMTDFESRRYTIAEANPGP
jgi:cyanophycinase